MAGHMDRFWEIDLLRGFAVFLMLLYHFLYDLNFFKLADINLNSGFFLYAGRTAALLFILISGTALAISHSRGLAKKNSETGQKENFSKYLKRGIKLFFMGFVLSAVTWIFLPEEYIVFGILHFFGVSAILVYPFLKYRKENLFFSFFFILIGFYLRSRIFDFSYLLWLGFTPANFTTLDYFPIFPWFGVLLAGVFLGNSLYANGNRQFQIPETGNFLFFKFFSIMGQHSLFIYFVHQPLFLGLLFLGGLIKPGMI
jgi:uncharacterized membrane protein